MPTYDYECPKGHTFETFQKMTAKPGAKCPKCGARARRKISGGAGFLFKGAGFYITDYRSDDYKKKASSEAGEGSSKGDTSKGDTSKGGEEKGGKSERAEGPAAEGKSSRPSKVAKNPAPKSSGSKRPKKPSGR
jgi:putative FmdB family regulatory protein